MTELMQLNELPVKEFKHNLDQDMGLNITFGCQVNN